jgi:hypothetical protein
MDALEDAGATDAQMEPLNLLFEALQAAAEGKGRARPNRRLASVARLLKGSE